MKRVQANASSVASRWLERQAGHSKEARALRVYEYADRKGVVFWSFTKLPFNAVRQLDLTDIRGTHFRTHISDVHRAATQMDLLEG